MGKTFRDRPAVERQIQIRKHERGEHRKMSPYRRSEEKRSNWDNQNF